MRKVVVVTVVALAACPALAQSVWVAPSTQKIRPSDASGSATSVSLEAARNELEAVHVVVNGGAAGAKAVSVAADALHGPAGGVTADVPVKLYVHAFALPSTASLPSAFGIGPMDPWIRAPRTTAATRSAAPTPASSPC